jgi:hypothetical protein
MHYDPKKYNDHSTAAAAAREDLQRDYPGQIVAVIWTSPGVGWLHDMDDQFTFKDHFEVSRFIGTKGFDALVMDPKRKSFAVEFYSDRKDYASISGDFLHKRPGDKWRFEFPSTHVRTWNQAYLPTIGNLRLKDICFPATHDSGMYKLTGGTVVGGRKGACLTQSCSIYDQLQLGARKFDIRPFFYDGKWSFGHFSPVSEQDLSPLGPLKQFFTGWQGGTGATIEEIVNDFNKFTAVTQELVIIDISHVTHLDPERSLTPDDRRNLLNIISKIERLYRDPNPKTVSLGDKTMVEYINGRSSVLVTFEDGPFSEDEINPYGFYHHSRLSLGGGTAFTRTPSNEETVKSIALDMLGGLSEKDNKFSVYNISKNFARDAMPNAVRGLLQGTSHLDVDYLDNADPLNIALAATLNRANNAAGKKETISICGGSLITSPDVKAKVEAAIASRSDYFVSTETLGGDPWFGVNKSCVVWYYVDGHEKARFAREGEKLVFSD